MKSMLTNSVSQIVAPILDSAELSERLTLAFGDDISVGLQTNSLELIDVCRDYFREFLTVSTENTIDIHVVEMKPPELNIEWTVKPPDPGKEKIKEEFHDFSDGRLVRKRLTGVAFAMTNDLNLAFGPCLENSNQVINFINNRYIEWQLRRGGILAHAAGVELNGRGIALAGSSGMGKSTLALRLLNEGCRFVSNDRLVIRKEQNRLLMCGVAKHPRVNPGTVVNSDELNEVMPEEKRKSLASLPEAELWDLEQKYDIRIDEIYGEDRFLLKASLDAVAILNWQRDGGELDVRSIDLRQQPDLLQSIMKQPGLFYRPLTGSTDQFSESHYIEQLQVIPSFEFYGGVDFGAASSACLEILEGSYTA